MYNRQRRQGFSVWLPITLVSIFLGMLLILLYGTGVFKNWGKRGQEQEAETALYKALAKLDEGKLGDMSGSFQSHQAGRTAREIYNFLRSDIIEEQALDKALAGMPKDLPSTVQEAKQNLALLKQGMNAIDDANKAREQRSGKLMLVLKSGANTSDRLNARYRVITRDFTETDNLYGGRERLLALMAERQQRLIRMHEILIDLAGKWRRGADGKYSFTNPDDPDAIDFLKLEAEIALADREADQVRTAVGTAVAAEREGMRRRLGL